MISCKALSPAGGQSLVVGACELMAAERRAALCRHTLSTTRRNPLLFRLGGCGGHLNRKNALFAGHDEDGKAWERIASLIETAKVNDVEPFAYLKATLEAIAAGHPQNRIDDLPPWNFQTSS